MDDIILKAIVETDTDAVTSRPTVTAGYRTMDGMRGRRGKYKNLTVFLMPVTDTPAMTPFSTYGLSHHPLMESSFPLMLCCKDTNGPFAALNIVSYKTYKVYIFLSSFLFRSLKEVSKSIALKSVQMA